MSNEPFLTTSPFCLTVTPLTSLIDETVAITLSGLQPGQMVKLCACTRDGSLKEWRSQATFVADKSGTLDVSTQQPQSGSYDEADPLGLFWSMSRTDTKRPTFFTKTRITPLSITITAEVDGETIASANVERIFSGPGVQMRSLQENGLIGSLFLPAGPGPHPGLLLLNGSDGGMREHAAALLASRGFAILALAYFGVEDLPAELVRIPLEYFEKALHWLQIQNDIDADRLGVIGLSRGGELALLLGATFPAIKAVVAGAPSGIVQSGIKNNSNFTDPAWTARGEPLAYMAYKRSFIDSMSFLWHWLIHKPISNKGSFEKALTSRIREIEAATIPVENIQGPVLLITGGDDQLWPSPRFSDMIIKRLKHHHHPYKSVQLNYPDAGHFVCVPYGLPSMPPMTMLSPVAGMYIVFGGTPKANAVAAGDAWFKTLSFLREHLASET